MKIASFNINGVKARLPALLDWLRDAAADVVVLQELKATDDQFPRLEIEEMGYNIETHGQKSFNGVAILSRLPIEDLRRGLPGDDGDEQARWIEATVAGIRVCGLYLPNGNPAPGPKYDYKLAWMARLETRAAALIEAEETAVILGDYNVIPEPRDCWDPKVWSRDALFLPETRAAFRRLEHLGLTDALRAVDQGPGIYTFWDYQAGAFQKNWGIRIDHVAADPAGRRPPRDLRHRRRDPLAREALRPRARLGHPRRLRCPAPGSTSPGRSTADLPIYAEPGYRDPPFAATRWCAIAERGFEVWRLAMGTQTGTHIDAPAHFAPGGATLDALAPDDLVGRYFHAAQPAETYAGERLLYLDARPATRCPNAPWRPSSRSPAGSGSWPAPRPSKAAIRCTCTGRWPRPAASSSRISTPPRCRGSRAAARRSRCRSGSPASPAPRPASWSAPPAKAVRRSGF